MSTDLRYAFNGEWFDPNASMIKQFKLLFHPADSSVEMFHLNSGRIFLKRTKCDHLQLSDFFLGNVVMIISRSIRIVDFGDEFTKRELKKHSERAIFFVKPNAVCNAGRLLELMQECGFKVCNLKMVRLSLSNVRTFFSQFLPTYSTDRLLNTFGDRVSMAVEVTRLDANQSLTDMLLSQMNASGDTQLRTLDAIENHPDLLLLTSSETPELVISDQSRWLFAFPVSQTLIECQEPVNGSGVRGVACLDGTTLAIVKPHCINEGRLGEIWCAIQEAGFCVQAARMFRLTKAEAAEFLAVYKGVLHEFADMTHQLSSGPCVVMEIGTPSESTGEDTGGREEPAVQGSQESPATVRVHAAFRAFVGPIDSEIARHLRPHTLRARFGRNKIENAIHCTDLVEDASSDVRFFFKYMDY